MQFPETKMSHYINNVVSRLGMLISWVWVILLVVIVVNVLLRYAFSEGRVEFEEIQWHLYSFGFLLGIPYAIVTDSHIRVDVFRERFSDQTKAWIELYGLIFLLMPFLALVILNAIPFVEYSYVTGEVSEAPAGLPFRWIIKATLLIAFLCMFIVAVSRLSQVLCFLFNWPQSISRNKVSNEVCNDDG